MGSSHEIDTISLQKDIFRVRTQGVLYQGLTAEDVPEHFPEFNDSLGLRPPTPFRILGCSSTSWRIASHW